MVQFGRLLLQANFRNQNQELQSLQRCLIEHFVKIVVHCQNLQLTHLDTLKSQITDTLAKFEQVDIVKDQDLFIDHNRRVFIAPEDWTFEPCSVHYDTVILSNNTVA
uniref:Uncharacterized protein n=1 Tax=Psilocybe cubensis TaxID=181762 RepID=A0A8H8CFN3_PSICU